MSKNNRYIKLPNGQLAGSIGLGKDNTPQPSKLPPRTVISSTSSPSVEQMFEELKSLELAPRKATAIVLQHSLETYEKRQADEILELCTQEHSLGHNFWLTSETSEKIVGTLRNLDPRAYKEHEDISDSLQELAEKLYHEAEHFSKEGVSKNIHARQMATAFSGLPETEKEIDLRLKSLKNSFRALNSYLDKADALKSSQIIIVEGETSSHFFSQSRDDSETVVNKIGAGIELTTAMPVVNIGVTHAETTQNRSQSKTEASKIQTIETSTAYHYGDAARATMHIDELSTKGLKLITASESKILEARHKYTRR